MRRSTSPLSAAIVCHLRLPPCSFKKASRLFELINLSASPLLNFPPLIIILEKMIFGLEAVFDRRYFQMTNTGGQRPPLNQACLFPVICVWLTSVSG